MSKPDAIIEELHEIRDAIAKAGDNDLKRIAEAARTRQKDSGHEVVQLPPKRVDRAQKVS
jgi:hypothetical protein